MRRSELNDRSADPAGWRISETDSEILQQTPDLASLKILGEAGGGYREKTALCCVGGLARPVG